MNKGLELYLDAFFSLDGERSVGFGPGPIPWGAMSAYASIHEFDSEQSRCLIYYVKRMDAAYLEYANTKAEKDRKK